MKLKCIRYRDGRRRDSFLIEKEVGEIQELVMKCTVFLIEKEFGEIQEQVMKMNCIPYRERSRRDSGAGHEDELYSL